MIETKDENGILHIQAKGELSEQGYDEFVPVFERVAGRKSGTVPMLIELSADFSGWDITGLWRDLKFDIRHKDQFGRIAIVGDKKWEEWGTKLTNPLFPDTEMKFFEPAERDLAEAWVRKAGNA